jgi:hypothetical protein
MARHRPAYRHVDLHINVPYVATWVPEVTESGCYGQNCVTTTHTLQPSVMDLEVSFEE